MGFFVSQFTFKLENEIKIYFNFIENLEYRRNKRKQLSYLLTFNYIYTF